MGEPVADPDEASEDGTTAETAEPERPQPAVLEPVPSDAKGVVLRFGR